MAKSKPSPGKIELVSITYKVDGQLFAKTINKPIASKAVGAKKAAAGSSLAPHPIAADSGCGEGRRCVNGLLEILICFGGDCQWEPTGLPCNC